jgi:hypothetical protein
MEKKAAGVATGDEKDFKINKGTRRTTGTAAHTCDEITGTTEKDQPSRV